MATLYERYGDQIPSNAPRHTTHYLEDLCESIISQQLSVKAASTIFARASAIIQDWNSADRILASNEDELRTAGLSFAKIKYVKNLAQHVKDQKLPIDTLDTLDDESVIAHLCEVKGIGRWTAEMFLMFSMSRPDIFSFGDQGLKNAVTLHYGIPLNSEAMTHIVASWSPYRSTAARVLWKSLSHEPLPA